MIRIDLTGVEDTKSILVALADPSMARQAAGVAAETYHDQTLNWIADGKSFTPRNGHDGLEGSIGWRMEGDSALVFANKFYAVYIEEGTGLYGLKKAKYPIVPKNRKALAWPSGNKSGFTFSKKVMHPGIKAKPFFFADPSGRARAMETAILDHLKTIIERAG